MKPLSFILVLGLGALAGCNLVPPAQTDSTRFYVLTAGPAPAAAETAAPGALRVGLKAVALPGYLKTPEIVVRRGANEIAPQDYARWGEPLEAGVARAVRAQLQGAANVGQLFSEPFPLDADRDYDVSIEITRCEGDASSGRPTVRFAATYEITTAGADARVVARKTFAAPEVRWDGNDFGRLAGQLSEAAAGLGREIAAALPPPPAKN